MADIGLQFVATINAGQAYTVPQAQEIILKSVRASYNGASAAGSFVPMIQIVAPGGLIVSECPLGKTLAAGASADVSWFSNGGLTTSLDTTNTGATVTVNPTTELLIGSGLTLTQPSTGTAELVATGGSGDIFWPAADQGAASYDKTTWANSVSGTGFYDTLKFPTGSGADAAFATAHSGDSFPRMLVISTMDVGFTGGILMGDGTIDPFSGGNAGIGIVGPASGGNVESAIWGAGAVKAQTGKDTNSTFILWQSNGGVALEKVQNPALGTPGYLTLYSGHGVPTIGGNLNDGYFRQDGAGGSWLYRCTGAGVAGVATWAAMV